MKNKRNTPRRAEKRTFPINKDKFNPAQDEDLRKGEKWLNYFKSSEETPLKRKKKLSANQGETPNPEGLEAKKGLLWSRMGNHERKKPQGGIQGMPIPNTK